MAHYKIRNTHTCKRSIRNNESKNNKFWQNRSWVSFRNSLIQREYVNELVAQWISETEIFKHKITYLMHTTSGIDEELRR